MDGPTLVAIVERELKRKRIRKAEFYRAIGITSATFSYWRNNIYSPSVANIKAISEFLGLELSITFSVQNGESEQKNTAASQGDGVSPAVSAHEKTPIGSESADRRSEEFAELFVKLNDAEKDIVLAQLRGLAQGR